MNNFLNLFADASVALNSEVPAFHNQGNHYQPGIGPYAEDEIVKLVITHLINTGRIQNVHIRPNANARRQIGLNNYFGLNSNPATPDLVYENNIIEFKICRPLRDNGEREDTWFKKVFEPNPQSYSTFLDVVKLCRFRDNYDRADTWQRWVVVIGFERRDEAEYVLDQFFPDLFNFISSRIVNLPFTDFIACTRDMGDRHPFHQILKLYAFRY